MTLCTAACAADRVEPAPFQADGYADDESSSSPSAQTSKSSSKKNVITTTNATQPAPSKIQALSCTGATTPDIDVTAAETGTLPAGIGGTIEDGTWIMETAERESATASPGDVLEQRHGMIRFSGNQFAWLDDTVCMKGTYTTNGSTMTFTTTDGTSDVTYTADAGGFTLMRTVDEAYHYAKQ